MASSSETNGALFAIHLRMHPGGRSTGDAST